MNTERIADLLRQIADELDVPTATPDPDGPLTTAEVASRLRTSVETLRYWRSVGKGPKSYKVGRRVLYDAPDVARWLTDRKEEWE